MNEGDPMDDQVLAKYIAGEADAGERALVEHWSRASPANTQELERMRAVWNWGAEGSALPEVDTDAAWARLNERLNAASSRGRVIPLHVRRWLAAAAVITGLVIAARWLMMSPEQVYVADASYAPVRLADSSAVMLSPGSRLSASMGARREVSLKGEAYFEVLRDAQHPFVISAGAVEVTVLGTAFTVSAYDTADAVLVRVREGRVQVVAAEDTLVLTAGEHARFDKRGHFLRRQAAPPAEIWGERIIQFEDAPLGEVVGQLQRLFHVRIDLAHAQLASCRLTATFEDESIDRVLEVIAETYGLSLTQPVTSVYVLEGDGCE